MPKDKLPPPPDSQFGRSHLPEHGRSGAHTEQWYADKTYRVVRGYTMGHLEANVNKLIDLGWQPFGTLQVIPSPPLEGYTQQQMLYFREMTRNQQKS